MRTALLLLGFLLVLESTLGTYRVEKMKRRHGTVGNVRRRHAAPNKPRRRAGTAVDRKDGVRRRYTHSTPPTMITTPSWEGQDPCVPSPWSEWTYEKTFHCNKWFTRYRLCQQKHSKKECELERCHTTTPEGQPSIPKYQEGKFENDKSCTQGPGVTTNAPGPGGSKDCILGPWSEWKFQRHFACVAWFTRSRHCVHHKHGANCKLEECYTTTPDGRPSIPKMQEGRYENQTDCSGEPGPTWTPPSTWTPMPPSKSTWTPVPPSESTWTTMPPSESTWTTMPPSETTWTTMPPSETTWTTMPPSEITWTTMPPSETTWTDSTPSTTWSPSTKSTTTWAPSTSTWSSKSSTTPSKTTWTSSTASTWSPSTPSTSPSWEKTSKSTWEEGVEEYEYDEYEEHK